MYLLGVHVTAEWRLSCYASAPAALSCLLRGRQSTGALRHVQSPVLASFLLVVLNFLEVGIDHVVAL